MIALFETIKVVAKATAFCMLASASLLSIVAITIALTK